MSETASGAAAGFAGWKFIGGAAGMAAGGAGLAAVVVMCMTQPRSKAEWAVSLISTVVGSLAGGAALILQCGLLRYVERPDSAEAYVAIVGLLGLSFACGLPAWVVVRWCFTWMERRKDKDIGEVVDEVRSRIGGGK